VNILVCGFSSEEKTGEEAKGGVDLGKKEGERESLATADVVFFFFS